MLVEQTNTTEHGAIVTAFVIRQLLSRLSECVCVLACVCLRASLCVRVCVYVWTVQYICKPLESWQQMKALLTEI